MDHKIMVNIGTKESPNFVEQVVEFEVEKIVQRVIRDTFCNIRFPFETTFEQYEEELQDNITYGVLQMYREYRYQKIEDAFYVINKCAGYLYELMRMYKAE